MHWTAPLHPNVKFFAPMHCAGACPRRPGLSCRSLKQPFYLFLESSPSIRCWLFIQFLFCCRFSGTLRFPHAGFVSESQDRRFSLGDWALTLSSLFPKLAGYSPALRLRHWSSCFEMGCKGKWGRLSVSIFPSTPQRQVCSPHPSPSLSTFLYWKRPTTFSRFAFSPQPEVFAAALLIMSFPSRLGPSPCLNSDF